MICAPYFSAIALRAITRYAFAAIWILPPAARAIERMTAAAGFFSAVGAHAIAIVPFSDDIAVFPAPENPLIARPALELCLACGAWISFCASEHCAENTPIQRILFALFIVSALIIWCSEVAFGAFDPIFAGTLSGISVLFLKTVSRPISVRQKTIQRRLSDASSPQCDPPAAAEKSEQNPAQTIAFCRFIAFCAVALTGFALIALCRTHNAVTYAIAWLCVVLLGMNSVVWPFEQIPEWLGYAERRRCFLDRRKRRLRICIILFAAIGAIALFAAALIV